MSDSVINKINEILEYFTCNDLKKLMRILSSKLSGKLLPDRPTLKLRRETMMMEINRILEYFTKKELKKLLMTLEKC